MPARFTQHNQRFRPSSKEDHVVDKAKEHFERTLVAIRGELAGSVAALEHPNHDEALNYGEIFLRDNVPVMIYLLLQNRFPVVIVLEVRPPTRAILYMAPDGLTRRKRGEHSPR